MKFLIVCLLINLSFAGEGIICQNDSNPSNRWNFNSIMIKKNSEGSYDLIKRSKAKAQTISNLKCDFIKNKNVPNLSDLIFDIDLLRCVKGQTIVLGTVMPENYYIDHKGEVRVPGPRYTLIILNDPLNNGFKSMSYFSIAQKVANSSTTAPFTCRNL